RNNLILRNPSRFSSRISSNPDLPEKTRFDPGPTSQFLQLSVRGNRRFESLNMDEKLEGLRKIKLFLDTPLHRDC
ncbi:MAG: hypothetical protein AAF353_05440, partial [Pseudomonadota bacterium]